MDHHAVATTLAKSRMKGVTLFIVKETPKVREFCSEISRNEAQATRVRPGDGFSRFLKGKKIDLLLGISRDPAPERASDAGPLHPGVLRAIAYLEEHFAQKISLETLAKSAYLSKFHFCHLFRDQTGKSPKAYLDSIRVSRAKDLLKQRQMSIAEVGWALGFSDPSGFSKTFARIEGVPPLAYRRSHSIGLSAGKQDSSRKKQEAARKKAGQRSRS